MSTIATTNGASFTNARAFVTARWGEGAWAATVARLGAEDRYVLQRIGERGPLALYARVVRALDEVHGGGDLALLVQLGRFEADAGARAGDGTARDPGAILERLSHSWSRTHDTGRWELQQLGDANVSATLHEWGHADYALCRQLVGYLGRRLELAGADVVVVEHVRCRGRGDVACVFRARWSAELAQRLPPTSASMRRAEVVIAPARAARDR